MAAKAVSGDPYAFWASVSSLPLTHHDVRVRIVGFRDDIRRLSELHQANPGLSRQELQAMLEADKQQTRGEQYADYFAPAAIRPYIEVVPPKVWKKDLNAFVKTYIGIVGLQPEDTFGIYTEPWGENAGPLSIVYRDRPEYEHGRRRYREVVLGR
jgi:hypothetical protein